MAFLKSGLISDFSPVVRAGQEWMRFPQMTDYVQWAELRARSREHLVPWEPRWAGDELSRFAFRRRLRHYQREQRDDQGYAFSLFRTGDDVLLGGVTLSNVRRGVAQSASLGYWIGLPFVRRGHMSRAVSALVDFAFEDLGLHRVEAACLPSNVASIGVLERNGFRNEGLARRYLRINGVWQDHLLYAKTVEDREAEMKRAEVPTA